MRFAGSAHPTVLAQSCGSAVACMDVGTSRSAGMRVSDTGANRGRDDAPTVSIQGLSVEYSLCIQCATTGGWS